MSQNTTTLDYHEVNIKMHNEPMHFDEESPILSEYKGSSRDKICNTEINKKRKFYEENK